ncbi:hypothetical protein HY463_01755 [Candidatus Peregrinibacteria bacterium]|nr:hypothetical protein [Candidatus Peregrinibacteria bacterium]
MFLFRSHKKLGHKQTSVVGFVIAVMSLLITAILAFVPPKILSYLYQAGIGNLELYFILFSVVLFISLQALVLFGFPIFYAQDKKDHNTGFQVLLYGLMWMVILFAAVVLISSQFFATKTLSLDDLQSTLDTSDTGLVTEPILPGVTE